MIFMLAVLAAGLGQPQVVEVVPGKPVLVTCAPGARTRVVFPEGGPSAGLDLPSPAVLAALGFSLEAQDPRVIISVAPQNGFEKAGLDFFGPSVAVHLEIQTAPGAASGEIRLQKASSQEGRGVLPSAPAAPHVDPREAPEASTGPSPGGGSVPQESPGAERASSPPAVAKGGETEAAAAPPPLAHEVAGTSEPPKVAPQPTVPEATTQAPAAPRVVLTVSRDIGRAVGLRGQRRVILERLYEPADLQKDSKLWLEFRQVGGANTRAVAIATSWGESPSFTSRADGTDLLLRVEVPNRTARSKKAWIELDLGGQKYRFKSLTTPTVFNAVKELIK